MNGETLLYIDQYGQQAYAQTVKELCEKFGYSRGTARRMYVDKKDGTARHVGYVVGPHWFTMFRRVESEA